MLELNYSYSIRWVHISYIRLGFTFQTKQVKQVST